MKKGHYEVSFKEVAGYSDYISKTMNEVILLLVQSEQFKNYEVTEIKYVEDK